MRRKRENRKRLFGNKRNWKKLYLASSSSSLLSLLLLLLLRSINSNYFTIFVTFRCSSIVIYLILCNISHIHISLVISTLYVRVGIKIIPAFFPYPMLHLEWMLDIKDVLVKIGQDHPPSIRCFCIFFLFIFKISFISHSHIDTKCCLSICMQHQ